MKTFILFTFALLVSGTIKAQLTAPEKDLLIDSLCAKLEQYYVFPEKAEKAIQFIREEQKKGSYNSISDEQTFASQISADLRKSGRDQHLRLEYSNTVLPDQNNDPYVFTAEEEEMVRRFTVQENFGIRKVDILKGNIGLIDFSCIFGAGEAGEKYAAIMDYLSHTDALIIDLRNCRGAMGVDGISFFASYFFRESVHLNDLVWRRGNRTEQKWTYSYLPGKRYLDKPVYVVTSARTFSGGEAFSYNMQALERITVVGEQTRGGANPGISMRLSDHFSAFIPNGTTLSPVTHSNWEGVGVTPDISEKANRALYESYKLALNDCITSVTDSKNKTFLANWLEFTEGNPPVFKQETFKLKGHLDAQEVFLTGTFNNWARKTIPMQKQKEGWVTTVECEAGINEYRFIVDEVPVLDPDNERVMKGLEFTNSVRIIQ